MNAGLVCRSLLHRPWLRLLPAALAGLLLAAAFPPLSWGACGFFALIPLLLVAEHRPFACGFVAGLGFFAPLLYWLNIVMTTYGGLAPFFSVVAWMMLCAFLALYFGAALWLAFLFQRRLRIALIFSLPLVWVAAEYLRGHLFSGFPWGLTGYAAIDMSNLCQAADLLGVYGLSWLFVLVNCAGFLLIRQPGRRSTWLVLAGTGLILAASWLYGAQLRPPAPAETLQVGLIQGNIEQQHKWDPAFRQRTLDSYRRLSFAAVEQGAELLIWPEAATPFYLQDPGPYSAQVFELVKQSARPLLLGAPAYTAGEDGSYRYHNSAYLLAASGRSIGRSDKIHLVPFGEYVPLAKLLFFVNKLVTGVGDYTPGQVNPLSLNGHQLGVLICYEAIFPELARRYVVEGTDLLINITNDAWFGRSSAPRQLLDMTRMRAIENRIWIARAANTGISALITPDGQALHATAIFTPAQVVGQVGLGAASTLYVRYGDRFAQACVLLTALGALGAWRRRGLV
jgi:apolipoprotein N-acyltransferase